MPYRRFTLDPKQGYGRFDLPAGIRKVTVINDAKTDLTVIDSTTTFTIPAGRLLTNDPLADFLEFQGTAGNTFLVAWGDFDLKPILGWNDRVGIGIANSIQSGGKVTAPGGNVSISGSANLAVGNYNIWVVAGLPLGTPVAADFDNMKLILDTSGGIALVLSYGGPNAGLTAIGPLYVTITAADVLDVRSIGAGSAGVTYAATFWAVPVP